VQGTQNQIILKNISKTIQVTNTTKNVLIYNGFVQHILYTLEQYRIMFPKMNVNDNLCVVISRILNQEDSYHQQCLFSYWLKNLLCLKKRDYLLLT